VYRRTNSRLSHLKRYNTLLTAAHIKLVVGIGKFPKAFNQKTSTRRAKIEIGKVPRKSGVNDGSTVASRQFRSGIQRMLIVVKLTTRDKSYP